MSKCCNETTFFDTDTNRQVRSCNDLFTDSDFLLKLISLILVVIAILGPIYCRTSIYTKSMAPETRYLVSHLYYAAAIGAVIALFVLLVLVVVDEERRYMEVFFLIVYGIFLLAAGAMTLMYIAQYPGNQPVEDSSNDENQETTTVGTRSFRENDEKANSTKPDTDVTEAPTPTEGGGKRKRAAKDDESFVFRIEKFMPRVFRTRNSTRSDSENKPDRSMIVCPVLLILAGLLMLIDLVLECCIRTYC